MSDHLITRPPGITTCGECRTTMLAATIGGLDRHVDPVALNTDGMLAAARAGIPLFLQRGSLLYTLAPEHIAAGEPLVVMPAHTCGRPAPHRFIDADRMVAAVALVTLLLGGTPVPVEVNNTPPF